MSTEEEKLAVKASSQRADKSPVRPADSQTVVSENAASPEPEPIIKRDRG